MDDTQREQFFAAWAQQLRGDALMGIKVVPLAAREALPRSRPKVHSTVPAASRANPPRPSATTSMAAAPGVGRAPPIVGDPDKVVRLQTLNETQVRGCRKCPLCAQRTQTVFGQGNASARVVFVGEGPGYEEDMQGLAFVGRAGQMLTRMILAMGLTREEVFICNVVKCRPPGNRTPLPEEIQACQPYLREQLEIIAPEMIVALGAPAAQTLLNTGLPIGRLRGRFHDYHLSGQPGVGSAIPVMPTYHPSYLLRTPGEKTKSWDDLQQVMARLGLKRPKA